MPADTRAILSSVHLFSGLSSEQIADCERRLPMAWHEPGAVLQDPTSPPVLQIVKRGEVRLFRVAEAGREVTIAVLGRDDVFGTMPLLGAAAVRPTFAQARRRALVCRIDEDALRDLLADYPQLGVELLRTLGRRLADAEDLAEDLALRSAHERVVRTVARLAARQRGSKLRVSHEEIAKAAGVVRETATKTLKDLERGGVIRTGYRSVTVVDALRLEAAATDG